MGTASVNQYYDTILAALEEKRKRPILMRPPFQYAQNLHQIVMEVKYAYRHDVSGCSTLQNETINATSR